jgi:alpha-mannosidase
MRLHLVPNSHIDPVWLWDKYEGIDEVLNTFRSNCDRLDEFPTLTFTASSLQFYEWVRDHDTKLFDRIGRFVAAGRWEVTGGWWVEADSNLPTAESMRKHAELSQAFARRYFGQSIEVAYLPDSFGHPATLPAILAETGFKYFLFCRPGAHENPSLPANLFWWEHSGHRILSYRLKFHYLQWQSREQRVAMLNDPEYAQWPTNCFLFGVGDHGGGPSIEEIRIHDEYIRSRPAGDAAFSSCLAFFREAERMPNVPAYSGDLHMHAVGCYAVQRDMKHAVRSAEHGLAFAARAGALAGQPADTALAPYWKLTLFNQFHDILPGSCAPHAALQCKAEMGSVDHAWRDAAYSALKSVSRKTPVATPEGEFRVFNTLPYPITVPLRIESFMYFREGAAFRDETGRELTLQEVVPSVRCANRRWEFVDTLPADGFVRYAFDTARTVERPKWEAAHFQPGHEIATPEARLAEGGVFSVGDTPDRHRPLFAAPPRFLVLRDSSDTWGHGVRAYDDVEGVFELASAAVLTGAVTSKLYQRWIYGHSELEIVWSLYPGLPRLDADITVQWRENRKLLKWELAPWGNRAPQFLMQGPGGACTRRTDGAELPLHHWVSIPGGWTPFALLQDGAFGCDCETGRLRVTLVRSSYFGYDENQRLFPADPQERTDQGEHRFRASLRWSGDLNPAALDQAAATFLEPCWVIRESGKRI